MRNNRQETVSDKALRDFIRQLCGFRVSEKYLALFRLVWVSNTGENRKPNNERLVFAGGHTLQNVLASYLFQKYPYATVPALEDMLERISHHAYLGRIAHRLKLDSFTPESQKEDFLMLRDCIHSDILKALVGAICTVKGYAFTEKLILKQLNQLESSIKTISASNPNHKGKLMAWAQKNKADVFFKPNKTVRYNGKIYHVISLYINKEWVANGCDTNVKDAEQHAAILASYSFHIDFDFT